MFISQDEIDKIIINGKNSHAYRLETYTYFVNHPDKADRIKYVGKDNQSGYLGGNDALIKQQKVLNSATARLWSLMQKFLLNGAMLQKESILLSSKTIRNARGY